MCIQVTRISHGSVMSIRFESTRLIPITGYTLSLLLPLLLPLPFYLRKLLLLTHLTRNRPPRPNNTVFPRRENSTVLLKQFKSDMHMYTLARPFTSLLT